MSNPFQSPPSVRKATLGVLINGIKIIISIPAFREEGDLIVERWSQCSGISIPAFREEGDLTIVADSAERAISIPAFREEGDGSSSTRSSDAWNFNPRLP